MGNSKYFGVTTKPPPTYHQWYMYYQLKNNVLNHMYLHCETKSTNKHHTLCAQVNTNINHNQLPLMSQGGIIRPPYNKTL